MSTTHAPRSLTTQRQTSSELATVAARTPRGPATTEFHELAHRLSEPIAHASDRRRYDRALEVLLGPGGANSAHLRPVAATPDVVRHRIAGFALAHLAPAGHPRHSDLVRQALAVLEQ